MDSVLANSQANLAYKQRELAKLTEFQLPQNPHLNLGEKHHYHETEELLKLTRDLKNDLDNRVPLSDPIAQMQQRKIQLLIAERQYTAAESQIRIIQGHILSGMDPSRSALSRTSDMKTTEEMQKQAQPLLNEAAELIKKARHSVTFAELGARQRMGSIMREQLYRENLYERVVDEVDSPSPENFSIGQPEPEPEPQQPLSPPPQQYDHQQWYEPPYSEENHRARSPPMMGREEHNMYPQEKGFDSPHLEKREKSGFCCSKCCIISFILLVACLAVGGGIYALIEFNVINI